RNYCEQRGSNIPRYLLRAINDLLESRPQYAPAFLFVLDKILVRTADELRLLRDTTRELRRLTRLVDGVQKRDENQSLAGLWRRRRSAHNQQETTLKAATGVIGELVQLGDELLPSKK